MSGVGTYFNHTAWSVFYPIYAFDHMLNIPRNGGKLFVNVFLNVNQPQAIHVNRYIRSEKVASYCAFMFSSYMFPLPAHSGSATPSSCDRFHSYIILIWCIIIFVFLVILYAYFHKL